VPPRWRAAGLPYLLEYGKNVELAAVAAAMLAGAATPCMTRTRAGRAVAAVLSGIGLVVLVERADLHAVLGSRARPQLLFVVFVTAALGVLWSDGAGIRRTPSERHPVERPRAWVVAPWLAVLAAASFVFAVDALRIDVFHHGEVLASAQDLLAGGRPFETFLWPHGLHDTGLAALWILATGKVGTSPIVLAEATCVALGVPSIYLLARRLLGSRGEALTACSVLALLPILLRDEGARRAAEGVLHQLGILVFGVLAFVVLTSRAPRRELWAGACLALAYLFRIEAGLFAFAAALGVVAYRGWEAPGGVAARLRVAASGALSLGLGCALVLCAARLVLGWPGAAWFAYTLRALPRYHTDAVGIPFPWPLAGRPVAKALEHTGVAALLFALLLVVQAARAVVRSSDSGPRERTAQLVFVAIFGALAMRSSLSRSDGGHLLEWGAPALLGALLLGVACLRDRFGWSRLRASLALGVLLAAVDFGTLRMTLPAFRGPAALAEDLAARGHLLAEHLSPNPPVGACGDTTLTPTEAVENRRFVDDTCRVEQLLRAHGVRELVIVHSAPWYTVRFGMALPSRYYAPARAYTPDRQLDLVADVRRHHPEALLRARGDRALERYDVPDALRVPVFDAYLTARREGVDATRTPLGDLYFWNEPAPPTERPAATGGTAEAAPAAVELIVDLVAHEAHPGLVVAQGWAADLAAGAPLASLELADRARFPEARLDYGSARPDVAAARGPAMLDTGFALVLPLPAGAWEDLRRHGTLALRGVRRDGCGVALTIDLGAARELGSLSSPEWDRVVEEMARAAALGRADRAAALRAPRASERLHGTSSRQRPEPSAAGGPAVPRISDAGSTTSCPHIIGRCDGTLQKKGKIPARRAT
jgi:hypothetical protein